MSPVVQQILLSRVSHQIGPGRRSVVTIHRRIEADQKRQLLRYMRGRYCWDPSIRKMLEGYGGA